MRAKCFESCNTDRGAPDHFTQVRLANFLSGGFITAIVVNPLERKLAKRTSVHCVDIKLIIGFVLFFDKKLVK